MLWNSEKQEWNFSEVLYRGRAITELSKKELMEALILSSQKLQAVHCREQEGEI